MTILEPGEDESGPSELLCDIVQHDHDRQCRQACGEQQQPILGESAQRREAIEDRDCDQEDQQRSKQADQIPAALDVIISPRPPASEMGIWQRQRAGHDLQGLVHHSDAGSQYTSIRYTERLIEAGAQPSIGSVGDSYDNALAESIIGLFKTELIRRKGPWRNLDAVELATLEWVDWYNNRRLFEAIGDIPPAEAEAQHYLTTTPSAILQMGESSLH